MHMHTLSGMAATFVQVVRTYHAQMLKAASLAAALRTDASVSECQ